MSHRRLLAALAVAAGILVAVPQSAIAHGLVGREDLPIPKWLFGWGATVVLIASFVGLAVLWPRPRLEQPTEKRTLSLPRILDPLCGAIGVAIFGLLVYAGFAGTQTTTANIAPTFVFVVFWVGLAVASVLFGDVFKAFNPWRAIARAFAALASLGGRRALPAPMPYPVALGRWPAAVGILAFAWVELVYTGRDRSEQSRRADARLRGRPARRHEPLRDRAVEPLRRRVRRLLRALRAHLAAALGARRALPAPAAERPDDARPGARDGRAAVHDDRHDVLRRLLGGGRRGPTSRRD